MSESTGNYSSKPQHQDDRTVIEAAITVLRNHRQQLTEGQIRDIKRVIYFLES